MKKKIKHKRPKYKLGDECIFTSRPSSGITRNDGKRCIITRVKPQEEQFNPKVPQYCIRFVGEDLGFGVVEDELSLLN